MTHTQTSKVEISLELQYRETMDPVNEDADTSRPYIGSGDGTASGAIEGTVRWGLFEAQGETVCDAHFVGLIETTTGELIAFDAVGYFQRDDPDSVEWQMAAGVQFETDAAEYDWLNDTLATWVGEMDARTYTHQYDVTIR